MSLECAVTFSGCKMRERWHMRATQGTNGNSPFSLPASRSSGVTSSTWGFSWALAVGKEGSTAFGVCPAFSAQCRVLLSPVANLGRQGLSPVMFHCLLSCPEKGGWSLFPTGCQMLNSLEFPPLPSMQEVSWCFPLAQEDLQAIKISCFSKCAHVTSVTSVIIARFQ